MMEIVVPKGVETAASGFWRTNEPSVLAFVLGDEEDVALTGGFAAVTGDFGEDMIGRVIVDVLRGIETQTVEVKFGDPISGVRSEELADGSGAFAIEVNGIAPIGCVPRGKVSVRK